LEEYKKGVGKVAYVGTCVLNIFINNDKVYVANLGDSRAELYRKDILNNEYIPIRLNNYHNAKSKIEQQRLKSEFPNDKDIIISNTIGNSFYVKGRLQPTRTLGDFNLKHRTFNQPPSNMEDKYKKRAILDFNGPYVKNIPQFTVHQLEKGDEFIVLATDGLWDFVKSSEVATIIASNKEKGKIARVLLETTMKHAAENQSISTDEIYSYKPGNDKRTIHDDITIMVIDLRNQVKIENEGINH
jgi:pyruvate dehydrogenase phosphatase